MLSSRGFSVGEVDQGGPLLPADTPGVRGPTLGSRAQRCSDVGRGFRIMQIDGEDEWDLPGEGRPLT